MNRKRYRRWAVAGISVAFAAEAIAFFTTPSRPQIGVPVPRSVSVTLRGGDPEPVCNWFKSDECKEVVGSSDLTTCPAQTYYYRDAQGTEYVKNNGSDYCGTQRTGNPQVYDCANVMIDIAGCAK